jgi:hypothetical protein
MTDTLLRSQQGGNDYYLIRCEDNPSVDYWATAERQQALCLVSSSSAIVWRKVYLLNTKKG